MDRWGSVVRGPAILASLFLAAACTNDLAPLTQRTRAPAPASRPSRATVPRSECGQLDVGGKRYRAALRPSHGPPGTIVHVSGPTLRGEDGRYSPEYEIELRWNESLPGLHPHQLYARRTFAVGTDPNVLGKCWFRMTFRVPRVPPGLYPIDKRDYHPGGYGIFVYPFRVTAAQ